MNEPNNDKITPSRAESAPASCSEITSLDELIAAIHATEGNGDMVSGTFGPDGFTGKTVSPNIMKHE